MYRDGIQLAGKQRRILLRGRNIDIFPVDALLPAFVLSNLKNTDVRAACAPGTDFFALKIFYSVYLIIFSNEGKGLRRSAVRRSDLRPEI